MMLKFEPIQRVAAGTKLAALAQAARAAASPVDRQRAGRANQLQDIQVQSLPGNRVELKLVMSDTGSRAAGIHDREPCAYRARPAGHERSA